VRAPQQPAVKLKGSTSSGLRPVCEPKTRPFHVFGSHTRPSRAVIRRCTARLAYARTATHFPHTHLCILFAFVCLRDRCSRLHALVAHRLLLCWHMHKSPAAVSSDSVQRKPSLQRHMGVPATVVERRLQCRTLVPSHTEHDSRHTTCSHLPWRTSSTHHHTRTHTPHFATSTRSPARATVWRASGHVSVEITRPRLASGMAA